MSKDAVFWIGVVPSSNEVTDRFKYGDYSWMQYSRYTWEYWCKKNNVEFIHYHTPTFTDMMMYKINWQRWFDVLQYIIVNENDPLSYDKIMIVDASIMVKWDAPNYFETVGEGEWGAVRATENMGWTYKSANGYADMFPGVNFNYRNYISSGFTLFQRCHVKLLCEMHDFYFKNHKEILRREDKTVLRGRDQPILNWFLQQYNVPMQFWTIQYGVNHLWRRQIINGNWQLNNPVPFFIKYFYAWIFSGFSDRGETRTKLMSQTWEIVREQYNE